MLDCTYVKDVAHESESLIITDIPEACKSPIEELADACCCRLSWDSNASATVSGSYGSIHNVEAEVLALYAKITFLENCLQKS
jgi:hypothetical protein